MNDARRKDIHAIMAELTGLKSSLGNLVSRLETARDDEQSYYDAMPEGIQASEKGEAVDNGLSALGDALDTLGNIESELDEITEQLTNSTEKGGGK